MNDYTISASITFNLKADNDNEARKISEHLLQNSLYQTPNGNVKLGYYITNIYNTNDITVDDVDEKQINNNDENEKDNKEND